MDYYHCNHQSQMNRQYIITTDDEDSNCGNKKGYKIHELILTIPQEDPDNIYLKKESLSQIMLDKDYLIPNEFCSNSITLNLPLENGDISTVQIARQFSKMTQTLHKIRDQSVNTTISLVSASTQTSNNHLSEDCSSNCSEQNSQTFEIPETNSKKFDSVPVDDFMNRNTDNNNKSSNKDSVVYTYSLKSEQSEDNNDETYYSQSTSNSLENLSDNSESLSNHQISIKSSHKSPSEIGIYNLLNNDIPNEECVTVSYIPAEIISNISHYTTEYWDYYRVFELKKFDEIIKSHNVRSDRRLKAISNRMLCKLDIIGPYQSAYSQQTTRNAMEWYNLIVYANSKLRLEKSINCIQLSFPTSCFNEKLYKSAQSLNR